jgi:hypothetical protein
MPADLLPISLDEMCREITRELEMRKVVFGKAVLTGRMNARLRDRRIDIIAAVLANLERQRHGNANERPDRREGDDRGE